MILFDYCIVPIYFVIRSQDSKHHQGVGWILQAWYVRSDILAELFDVG